MNIGVEIQQRKLRLTKPWIGKAEVNAVQRVLESGWLAEGSKTREFEEAIAKYVGSKYAIAAANCTVALELCLKAQRTEGSVVVPDFTHPATIQAVINAGLEPCLADVELDSYNLETNKPVMNGYFVVPVSWAGNPIAYDVVSEDIVEDAACSLGAIAWNGSKVGSTIASCFSLHPRKLITCGEGGVITTNDATLTTRIRSLKNFGKDGGNYKFDDVRAAIAIEQLKRIEFIIGHRVEMAHVYDDLLQNLLGVKPPQRVTGVRHTYQTYAVLLECGNRDQIIQRLTEKGIETQRGAYALHLLPQYQHVKQMGTLKNSEKLDRCLLALPMAYNLTDEDQKFVVSNLKTCLSQASNH